MMRFSSDEEIAAVRKAYERCRKFGDAVEGQPLRSYMAEIHMGNDRDLFGDFDEGLPLIEGRMVDRYDHRAKGYRSGRGRQAVWEDLSFGAPSKSIQPQWRVPNGKVPRKARGRVERYRVGFCDVTSPTNERSMIAALIPPNTICGDKVPAFVFSPEFEWTYMPWLAVANSFALDFIARKKVALKMSLGIVDSLPFPVMTRDRADVRALVPLAARLTCTATEMDEYWSALHEQGWVGDPEPNGATDDEERLRLKASIDAIVARDVFGLSVDEMMFVLSTFPTAARYEEARWGKFWSRELILEAMASEREGAVASG
jgi:hypothetical protein